jgi:hypothetical protein
MAGQLAVEPAAETVKMVHAAGGEMVSVETCHLGDPAECARLVEGIDHASTHRRSFLAAVRPSRPSPRSLRWSTGLSAGDHSEGVAPQWRDSPVAARSAVICIMLPRIVALSATRAVPSGP